jgi:hypothetical protein
MQTTVDKQKNALIKRFHTLIGKAGISQENKAVILAQYGVESSRDLTVNELIEVCTSIDYHAHPALAKTDRWRKRLLAAIFGWLKKMGKTEASMEQVKAIATRAAGAESFNKIPNDRLRSLYYAFSKKSKDLDFVHEVTAAEIDSLIHCN